MTRRKVQSRTDYLLTRLAAFDAVQLERVMLLMEPAVKASTITSPDDAETHLRPLLAGQEVEHLAVLFLDTRHAVIAGELLSRGSNTNTIVDPRVIFRRALQLNAAKLLVAHNHPSGTLQPSQADLTVTKRLVDGGQLLGVTVVDHLIITDGGSYSMLAHGAATFPNVGTVFTAAEPA